MSRKMLGSTIVLISGLMWGCGAPGGGAGSGGGNLLNTPLEDAAPVAPEGGQDDADSDPTQPVGEPEAGNDNPVADDPVDQDPPPVDAPENDGAGADVGTDGDQADEPGGPVDDPAADDDGGDDADPQEPGDDHPDDDDPGNGEQDDQADEQPNQPVVLAPPLAPLNLRMRSNRPGPLESTLEWSVMQGGTQADRYLVYVSEGAASDANGLSALIAEVDGDARSAQVELESQTGVWAFWVIGESDEWGAGLASAAYVIDTTARLALSDKDRNTGDEFMYLAQADGALQPLGLARDVYDMKWSANGTHLSIISRGLTDKWTVSWSDSFDQTVQVAGLLDQEDYEKRDHALSPDGAWLAWVSNDAMGTDEIYLLDTSSGQAHKLSTPSAQFLGGLLWSPDGRYLGFTAEDLDPDGLGYSNRSGQLHVYDTWTEQIEAVAGDLVVSDSDWHWSPTGRRVAMEAGGMLYVCSIDDSEPVRLTGPGQRPHHVKWSPDGSWLGYMTNNPKLLTVASADGSQQQVASRFPSDRLHYSWSWTPDGTGVTFAFTGSGTLDPDEEPAELWVVPFPLDPGQEWVETFNGRISSIEWWPGGTALIFTGYKDGWYPLWGVEIDGDEGIFPLTDLDTSASFSGFSPGGKYLAISQWRGSIEPMELHLLPLEGGLPVRVGQGELQEMNVFGWSGMGQ